MNKPAPTPSALAAAFTAELLECIGAENFATLCATTRAGVPEGVCHSHEFCDANQVLLDAFQKVAGRELFMGSDVEAGTCTEAEEAADWQVIQTAWDAAKDSWAHRPTAPAVRILKAVRGRVTMLAGPSNRRTRQALYSELLGRPATVKESGITNIENELFARAAVPVGCLAEKERWLEAWVAAL